MRKFTTENYNALSKVAKSFANRHGVSPDDVLSYLNEKIIPVIERYDDSYEVPFNAYLSLNARFLCKNYLRDEANLLNISKKNNYIPIKVESVLKVKPDLFQDKNYETISQELGMTATQVSYALAQNLSKFSISLDEHEFLQYFTNQEIEEIDHLPALEFLSGLEDNELILMQKFVNGYKLGDKSRLMCERYMEKIQDLILQKTI